MDREPSFRITGRHVLWYQRCAKQRVHHDFEHVVQHAWNHYLEQLVGFFEARIRVSLDQSRLERTLSCTVAIALLDRHYHKVVANKLKRMLGELQPGADRLVGVLYLFTHLIVEGTLDLGGLHA